MNKYSPKAHLKSELEPFVSTLKATSYDDANQRHLCHDESTLDVYDFDAYVKERCPHPTPASPDAIHIGRRDVSFVEFKNQKLSQVDRQQMQRKFQDGTTILQNLLQGFGAKDCKYRFCVVLGGQPRPPWMDFRHVEKSTVKFCLQEMNEKMDHFYDHIIIETLDFYVREFNGLQCA
jgi:hypothetical protein